MNTQQHNQRTNEGGKRERDRRRAKAGETTGGRLGCDPNLLDHEKYAYRWLNDKPGRLVQKTKNDDWDLVPQSGEKEDSTDMGGKVSVVVGTKPDGSPMRAFLARKVKKYFDEDALAAQTALDDQLEQLRRGKTRSGGSQSDYVPDSGIKVA